jgi:hypothetical protein
MNLYRVTLFVQTGYYLITAVWGLISIESFMRVTGPKTDVWLVKTVSVLLLAISTSFIVSLLLRSYTVSVTTLAISCCVVLIIIDCSYAANGTISKIYLLDAFLQLCFLTAWIYIIVKKIK